MTDAEDFNSELELDFIGQPMLGGGADQFGTYIGGSASAYFSDMLGDRQLGVALQASGTVKDIGAQVFYLNSAKRWNWGYSISRIPYQYGYYGWTDTDVPNNSGGTLDALALTRYRIFADNATGLISYPFSMTRRIEANLGFSRYSFDIEQDQILFDGPFQVGQRRIQLDEAEADPLNLFEASIAYVGDNSFTAFTSPVRGGRFRFGVTTTHGTVDYQTLNLDYRRYYSPNMNLTVAVRGMHVGRYNYGTDFLDSGVLLSLLPWVRDPDPGLCLRELQFGKNVAKPPTEVAQCSTGWWPTDRRSELRSPSPLHRDGPVRPHQSPVRPHGVGGLYGCRGGLG